METSCLYWITHRVSWFDILIDMYSASLMYRWSPDYVRLVLCCSEFTLLFKYIYKKISSGLHRTFLGYIVVLRCNGKVKVHTATV